MNDNFLSWRLKKVVVNVVWKIFLENRKMFSDEIENFCNRIHDPQDFKID